MTTTTSYFADQTASVIASLLYCACILSCFLSFASHTVLQSSDTCGGYRGGSPTAVQAWRTCPLWEPSPSHPILL